MTNKRVPYGNQGLVLHGDDMAKRDPHVSLMIYSGTHTIPTTVSINYKKGRVWVFLSLNS